MPTLIAALFVVLLASSQASADYDPLRATPSAVKPIDLDVIDAKRKRNIPIRIYLPADPRPAPVVLFSHGLGGNRETSAYLGTHWAARGSVTVFLQHPGQR